MIPAVIEEAIALGSGCAKLAFERVLVLGLTRYSVAFGDHFSGVAHHHVNAWYRCGERRVRVVIALHHTYAFDAAADCCVGSF